MDYNLITSNISKKFGNFQALKEINLNLKKGEVLGLLGPNGAGKTTLMRILTGFLTPTSGDVEIFGIDIKKNPKLAKFHIGYMPEGCPAYQDLTPLEFLTLCANLRDIPKKEQAEKINYAIAAMELETVKNKQISKLSKGFTRRVSLAQAILHNPKILILDEPTEGLDPNQKHEVRNLIKEISKDKSIIISTHIMEEVEYICSRISIINQGEICLDKTIKEIKKLSKSKNNPIDDIFRRTTKPNRGKDEK